MIQLDYASINVEMKKVVNEEFLRLRQRHNNKFKSLKPEQMSNGEGEGIRPQSEARRGWQALLAGIFPSQIIKIFSERQGNNITFKPHSN